MNSKYEVPESVVIVANEIGYTATIRYKNSKRDRMLSANKHEGIYLAVEDYVMGRVRNESKEKQKN